MNNIFFDALYLKEIFIFLGIPLFVMFVVFFIGACIYSITKKKKDHNYHYTMKFYSLLFAVVVCAFLLAISIAFSFNLIKDMDYNTLLTQYKILYIFILIFPLFSLIFLIMYMVLLFKCHKKKKHLYETDDVLLIDEYENEKDSEEEVI